MSPLTGVDDPRRLRDLLDAVLVVGSDLSLTGVLHHIVEAAVDLAGCRYGALGVIAEHGHGLSRFVTAGVSQETADAIGSPPEGHGILGLLVVDPRPLRLADLTTHPDSYGFPPHHPPMRSFLGVPIQVRGQVYGNLYLTEKVGAEEFTAEDESLVSALARAAGIAIENARLHERTRDLTLLEDRDRIASDLHDTVIQRLFATGLALQGVLKVVEKPEAAERIATAVDDLDETIRQIRSTVFGLRAPRIAGRSLRSEVLSLVTEAGATLRFEPHVRLDGPIDTAVDGEAAGHLLAVLREALSNVVRHAGASRVEVGIEVSGGHLVARVADNGAGPPRPDPLTGRGAGGLRDIAERASLLGGTVTFGSGPTRGAVLEWRVPVAGGAKA